MSPGLLIAVLAAAPDAGTPPLHFVSSITAGGKSYPTLQAAIDATPNGGTLKIPPGVYGEMIRLKGRKNLKLVADKGPALILHQAVQNMGWQYGTGWLALLELEDCSDVLLQNVWVRRDVYGERDPYRASAVRITGSKHISLQGVFIGGGDGTGLTVGKSDVSIVGSTIEAVQFAVSTGEAQVSVSSSWLRAQVPIARFGTPGCEAKALDLSRSRLEGDVELKLCAPDAKAASENVIITRRTAREQPLPDAADAGFWRPERELLEQHLPDFAVLPEPIWSGLDDVSVCSLRNETWWRLFPGGPTTAYTEPQPDVIGTCVSGEAARVQLVERVPGWVQLRVFSNTGYPSKMGWWLKDSDVTTPCVLRAGDERVWTHLMQTRSFEVIDDERVAVIGWADACRAEPLTETVAVKGARKQKLKLECPLTASAQLCGE